MLDRGCATAHNYTNTGYPTLIEASAWECTCSLSAQQHLLLYKYTSIDPSFNTWHFFSGVKLLQSVAIFCNKKFVLQENNRSKTYECKSRIPERNVNIISHGSNSEPLPTNVPQNEPDSTYKHSVDSFMHSSLCPPPKQASLGSSLSH